MRYEMDFSPWFKNNEAWQRALNIASAIKP